jgi:DNA-binding XRE family transcriptional regulator
MADDTNDPDSNPPTKVEIARDLLLRQVAKCRPTDAEIANIVEETQAWVGRLATDLGRLKPWPTLGLDPAAETLPPFPNGLAGHGADWTTEQDIYLLMYGWRFGPAAVGRDGLGRTENAGGARIMTLRRQKPLLVARYWRNRKDVSMPGDEFYRRRNAIGWSRSKMAKVFGRSENTIRQYEAGETIIPTRIAEWMTMVSDFLEANPPPRVKPDYGRVNRRRALLNGCAPVRP